VRLFISINCGLLQRLVGTHKRSWIMKYSTGKMMDKRRIKSIERSL
jgi:hypothetical protein